MVHDLLNSGFQHGIYDDDDDDNYWCELYSIGIAKLILIFPQCLISSTNPIVGGTLTNRINING